MDPRLAREQRNPWQLQKLLKELDAQRLYEALLATRLFRSEATGKLEPRRVYRLLV